MKPTPEERRANTVGAIIILREIFPAAVRWMTDEEIGKDSSGLWLAAILAGLRRGDWTPTAAAVAILQKLAPGRTAPWLEEHLGRYYRVMVP